MASISSYQHLHFHKTYQSSLRIGDDDKGHPVCSGTLRVETPRRRAFPTAPALLQADRTQPHCPARRSPGGRTAPHRQREHVCVKPPASLCFWHPRFPSVLLSAVCLQQRLRRPSFPPEPEPTHIPPAPTSRPLPFKLQWPPWCF